MTHADPSNQWLQVSFLLIRCERAADVHVLKAERVAKIWLKPLEVESNRGYNKLELNKILKLTEQNEAKLLEAWNEYFDR